MTLSVIVDIPDATWMGALPGLEELADDAARRTIAHVAPAYLTRDAKTEIGVVFIDDDFIRDLNKQYRGKDKPTNVLSFPLLSPLPAGEAVSLSRSGLGETGEGLQPDTILLGDVVLAQQTIAREAIEAGKTLAAHTQHLIVHGVLHLLGYDHEAENDANAMESLEIKILDAMGIANPYNAPTEID